MTSHAAWPLVWAFERLPRTQSWGRLLAHVVAGHHAGLKDDLLSPEGRIETKNALLAPVERAAQADGLALPGSVSGPAGMRFLKGERGFQMAFLTRMIFSCLIDADRTAAAAFDAHGVGIPEIEHPSITALETALHAAMGRRVVEPNQINTLRDEVLRAAVARAAEPQGVFTLTVPTGGGKTLRRRQDRAATRPLYRRGSAHGAVRDDREAHSRGDPQRGVRRPVCGAA